MADNCPIPNSEVIPNIESNLFIGHETAQFAVGILAVGGEAMPGLEGEWQGCAQLRANVYARQKRFMKVEDLDSNGFELDWNDGRSVQFGVIENVDNGQRTIQRVVGSMRLVIKSRELQGKLPIEELFPDPFKESYGPIPVDGNEASRVTARHENHRLESPIKKLLFAAGTALIIQGELGPTYAVVQLGLARILRASGMVVEELGEPELIPEYGVKKMPVRIDVARWAQSVEESDPGLLGQFADGSFVYSGSIERHSDAVVAA